MDRPRRFHRQLVIGQRPRAALPAVAPRDIPRKQHHIVDARRMSGRDLMPPDHRLARLRNRWAGVLPRAVTEQQRAPLRLHIVPADPVDRVRKHIVQPVFVAEIHHKGTDPLFFALVPVEHDRHSAAPAVGVAVHALQDQLLLIVDPLLLLPFARAGAGAHAGVHIDRPSLIDAAQLIARSGGLVTGVKGKPAAVERGFPVECAEAEQRAEPVGPGHLRHTPPAGTDAIRSR